VAEVTLQDPIIVKIVEPSELSGLADVLLGAIGLTGVLTLLAITAGVVVAGVLFWWRSRSTQ
jgi:hypothetical protein